MDSRTLPFPLGAGLACWCLLALAWPHIEPGDPGALTLLGYAAAAATFLAAGVAQVVRARITGQPWLDWSAVALLVAGAAIVLLGGLQRLSAVAAGTRHPAPIVRFLVLVPALILLAVGARRRLPRSGPTPRQVAIGLVTGYALVGIVFSVPAINATLHRTDSSTAWLIVGLATITGWGLLAARTATAAREPHARWRAVAFALTAASGVSYLFGLRGDGLADELSAGLFLAAAAVAATAAVGGLRLALAAGSRRVLALDAHLGLIRHRLDDDERRDAERLHDARAAALGIEAAVTERGDPELARTVSAELGRLVGLFAETDDPPRRFALHEALAPVIAAQRSAGLAVTADLAGRHAFGRPSDTARALANVLRNAAVHAPGAAVRVRAFHDGHTVSVVVDDDGPGIPETDRVRVLLRGTRGAGTTVPGSGLGLSTAAAAMAGQGGGLHLAGRPGGGTRVVLTLPADRQHHDFAPVAVVS